MGTDGFLDTFGVEVSARGQTFRAILEDEYQQAEFGRIRISSNAPLCRVSQSDLEAVGIVFDTVVDIGGVSYLVKEIQPDGFGEFTQLRLIESA